MSGRLCRREILGRELGIGSLAAFQFLVEPGIRIGADGRQRLVLLVGGHNVIERIDRCQSLLQNRRDVRVARVNGLIKPFAGFNSRFLSMRSNGILP